MTRTLLTSVRTLLVALTLTTAASIAGAAPKPPQTAADHKALAEHYKEKAEALRAEAKEHREMADLYGKKSGAEATERWTGEDVAKSSKVIANHQAMAADADKMAAEAEAAAEYHKLRAQELEGN